MVLIKTEPVQHTVKWEIKKGVEDGKGKGSKRSQRGGRTEESKQGYKGKGMLRG